MVESIVGKRENAGQQQFLLLSQCFQITNIFFFFFQKPSSGVDKRRDCLVICECKMNSSIRFIVPFSTLCQFYCGGQCTYPWFSGVLLTSTPHSVLSKPLAAFPHNHCRNNGQQWERNESCHNDCPQSSERIMENVLCNLTSIVMRQY